MRQTSRRQTHALPPIDRNSSRLASAADASLQSERLFEDAAGNFSGNFGRAGFDLLPGGVEFYIDFLLRLGDFFLRERAHRLQILGSFLDDGLAGGFLL